MTQTLKQKIIWWHENSSEDKLIRFNEYLEIIKKSQLPGEVQNELFTVIDNIKKWVYSEKVYTFFKDNTLLEEYLISKWFDDSFLPTLEEFNWWNNFRNGYLAWYTNHKLLGKREPLKLNKWWYIDTVEGRWAIWWGIFLILAWLWIWFRKKIKKSFYKIKNNFSKNKEQKNS